ncbi:PTS transporter subunit IIC [Lutispora saccharofermentans]|uniref:PTS sugar transporter subunit IIC n=1 Tax=Lutispora saccharofermentans TaxID=3024236 RepID=A0ABT1NJ75_9FIRM|nr:PTS sugar transporter subunit IIC [Lutispora saccharofermentans]
MALGLFSSLIVGLILDQIGSKLGISILVDLGRVAKFLMGPAIGIAVAYGRKAPALAVFSSAVTGALGAGTVFLNAANQYGIRVGEPMGAFIAALVGVEVGKLISGKTKVDIVLVPSSVIIAGGIAGKYISPVVSAIMTALGSIINTATVMNPIPMGILVSAIMGVVLTLPISSAALAIALGLKGLAAGAATVGCCTQMVGFAVASYRENKLGGLIAQGLGTSMLQMPNIIRNPMIWIPPTLASAILGPLSTTLFKMENVPEGAGMGTSGLVGQFGTFAAMSGTNGGAVILLKILILQVLLPAALTLIISEFMRKKGYIKNGDMKLDL